MTRTGHAVSGFQTRAPKSAPKVAPRRASVSKLGRAGTTGPASGQRSDHRIRIQGAQRATRSKRA
jgi:hypothetical protein